MTHHIFYFELKFPQHVKQQKLVKRNFEFQNGKMK